MFEIEKIKRVIRDFDNLQIWIVGATNLHCKIYCENLERHINFKTKPLLISTNSNNIDGYNPGNALIILCGNWYSGQALDNASLKFYLKKARFTMTLGELL